jgi:hypothetical protein
MRIAAISLAVCSGLCLLLCMSGCTTVKTTKAFEGGELVAKSTETCFLLPCTDPEVAQAAEGSFTGIRIGNPTGAGTGIGNIFEFGYGGASQVAVPTDGDICVRSGVEVDGGGNLVSADRETCTGQLAQ